MPYICLYIALCDSEALPMPNHKHWTPQLLCGTASSDDKQVSIHHITNMVRKPCHRPLVNRAAYRNYRSVKSRRPLTAQLALLYIRFLLRKHTDLY
jgi:hypothetical protein